MADLAEKRPADDAAEERRKKRKSRWGGEEEKAEQGVITSLPSSLTKDQQDAYLRMFAVIVVVLDAAVDATASFLGLTCLAGRVHRC